MDLEFVHTIGEDEDFDVVASSDDEAPNNAGEKEGNTVAPAAAPAKASKKGKKAKKGKKGKKGAKDKQAETANTVDPSKFGSKKHSSFFNMHDFDVADSDGEGHSGAQEITSRSAARQSEWDFEAGISTRKTMHFDGLTSLQQKIKEKRAKYAPSNEPAKSAEEAGDEGDDSDDAGAGGGESAGAAADASGSESDDGSGSGSGDDSGSDDDAEGDSGSGSSSGSEEEGSDAESSEGEDSGESEDSDAAAEAAAAAMEADRTRQIKEERIAPAEDAAGKDYFELDPFLASGAAEEAESFAALHLSRPLLRAVSELGYSAPTPIQRRVIPLCLAGRDVCGSAVTGSGKTAAFLLPALERLLFRPKHIPATRVLIVTPTRELATQILSMTKKLAKYTDIRAALAVGGHSLKVQEADLRARPDIVVCTPGRIIDLLRNAPSVHMDDVDILILDEADRLLEMGFKDEVEEIVRHCPIGRQTVLLSATMVAQVKELISLSLKKPVRVSADPLYDVAQRLSQEFVRIRDNRDGDREAILVALVTRSFRKAVIVFCPTKKIAHRLTLVLGLAGVDCGELHGDLSQQQRLDALNSFRAKEIDVLVATDLASRGLDIANVRTVINYTMPRDLTRYVHRVGRTARAGRVGVAVTLTGERNRSAMRQIVKRASTNVKSRQVPPEVIEYWRAKIESFEDDIDDILKQESVEKELRVAQMEVMRASNMMEHRDDIMSRPARTWFQSAAEKAAVKRAVLDQMRGNPGAGDSNATAEPIKTRKQLKAEIKAAAAEKAKRPHRLSRHKRRRLEAEREHAHALHRAKVGGDNADDDVKKRAESAMREQAARAGQHSKAKAVKATLRKAQKAMSASAGAAIKALKAGAAVPGVEKSVVVKTVAKSKKRSRSAFDVDAGEPRARVQQQRVVEAPSAGSQVKSGASRYADAGYKKDRSAGKRFTFTDQAEGRMLRKGGKPSRNAFKSKQRYNKRRKR